MPNVLIRKLTIEDASVSFRWRNDPEVWKYTGSKPDKIITEEIEKKWLDEKLHETNSSRFAIIVDNQYVGNIQITDIVKNDKGQYHIFIGEKAFWKKGIAQLATAQIIRFAREKLNLKEIYLKVDPKNVAALKLYENSGFHKINDEIEMSINLSVSMQSIVNVIVTTYNHEKFIIQALEGILMQKTSFDFDIVVGEDCSTDNTRKIVLAYANKYPGKFNLLLHEHNIGALANQVAVLQACTGKYIAICEGDDYWTDPFKLKKQVAFLEANSEYSLCSHRLHCYIQNSQEFKNDWMGELFRNNQNYADIDIDTFFNVWVTQTVSVVFKKECYDLTDYKKFSYYRDIHIFFNILQKGKGRVFNFYGAVYRAHDQGIWSKSSALSKQKLNLTTSRELFNNYNTPFLEKAYYGTLRGYISDSIKRGNTVSEFDLLLKEVKKVGFEKGLYFKLLLVSLLTKLGLGFLVIYGYKISCGVRKLTSGN